MKYFTPQIFVRLQDLRDEAAIQDWERASSAYAASLGDSLPQFPRSVQRLIREFALHDADVRSMTRSGNVLSITLQPDPPRSTLLVLSYTLIAPPQIDRSALPQEHYSEEAMWLYDEFALDEPISSPSSLLPNGDRERKNARVPVYIHSILLSNGWEVALKFRKFKLSCPEALLPAPCGTEEKDEALTRSA
jgi:hypothetical protein